MKWPWLLLSLAAGLAPAVAPAARAQTGGAYDLSWNTIDVGGTTTSAAGAYALGATAGQIDAGTMSAGAYVLTGGFWGGVSGSAAVDVRPPAEPQNAPLAFQLRAATPNPFERQTTVAFDLPHADRVTARVFNPSGAHVRTLVDEPVAAGRHEVSRQGTDDAGRRVAQGVYMLRLEAGPFVATRKLVLTR